MIWYDYCNRQVPEDVSWRCECTRDEERGSTESERGVQQLSECFIATSIIHLHFFVGFDWLCGLYILIFHSWSCYMLLIIVRRPRYGCTLSVSELFVVVLNNLCPT